MDDKKKQEFTRRISASNRGQLIVVMYDICFDYMKEAQSCLEEEKVQEGKEAIQNADRVLARLQASLDFKYPIALELYPLYTFARKELMRALYMRSTEGITHAKRVLDNLYHGFREAALQDCSEPLMLNTQQVYAGITYGKEHLNENFHEPDTSRGFFA